MASFTKWEILEYIVGNVELTPAINYILKKLNVYKKNIASDTTDRLRKTLFTLLRSKHNNKFEAACRKINYFDSKNSSYDSEFKIPGEINVDNSEKFTVTSTVGNPFDKKSAEIPIQYLLNHISKRLMKL